ncbi:MAG: 16S rRNA (cytidine(1402)-2'-O)-methyltransferase [Geobacteraceae bacterium]
MPSGTLYIVATPIGNLEDITFRAVRILKEVDLVAAEDTRHSRKLLTHLGISKPLTSYFDHNQNFKGNYLLDRLKEGLSVALISDAGTPCISDPGYQLVRDAIKVGIPVVPIPGASAVLAALSAGGLPTDTFTFIGFLPARAGTRRKRLATLKDEAGVLVLYESPKRLLATLADIRDICGDREVVVARELTKMHEEFIRGEAGSVLEGLRERQIRGEVVLLIGAQAEREETELPDAVDPLRRYLRVDGLSLKDAVKRAVNETGRPRGEVYAAALRIKGEE